MGLIKRALKILNDAGIWDKYYPETSADQVIYTKPDGTASTAQEELDAQNSALNSKEPAFNKKSAFNKNFGNAAGTVCEGNDDRLNDARDPKTHQHAYETIVGTYNFKYGIVELYPSYADAVNKTNLLGTIGTDGSTNLIIKNVKGPVLIRSKDNKTVILAENTFYPQQALDLGVSWSRWANIFSSKAVDVSSDRRIKHDIVPISELPTTFSEQGSNVLEKLFEKLVPVTFNLNSETDDKIHIGFIAQDVAAALEELGIEETGTGFLSHDFHTDEETGKETDNYGISYTELIALNTHMIKKCLSEINKFKKEIVELSNR